MMTDSMGLVKKDGSQCRVAATFDPACLLPGNKYLSLLEIKAPT